MILLILTLPGHNVSVISFITKQHGEKYTKVCFEAMY